VGLGKELGVSDTFEDEVLEDDPTDGGQVDEADGADLVGDLTDLDIEMYRNHQVAVQVDGEERRIPISEAVAGYQRQADYTRKTQELAQQRTELGWAAAIRSALDNDPQGTIELLQSHFGVANAAPTVSSQTEDRMPWDDDPAPVDARTANLEARLARFEEAQATADLHAEVARLQSKYGADFDPQEVVQAAVSANSTDLEATFKLIAFDRVMSRQGKAAKAAVVDGEKQAAKRVAGDAVSSGAASKGVSDNAPILSIADAYRAAKRSVAN